ncbi:MAG: phosphoenolpyruvate--protein phosphotransferase [Actinomycetes bacterium]
MNSLVGIGVSPGVAVGKACRIAQITSVGPIPATPRKVFDSLNLVVADLERAAKTVELDIVRDVLGVQAMMASDPALIEAIGARLSQDIEYKDVRPDIIDSFRGFKTALSALGGYFAERIVDLDDILSQLLNKLAGTEHQLINLAEPSIVIADELTPSDTAHINLNYALALVVAKGGPTSHAAIVARGLGIPAIVGCKRVLEIEDGSVLLVDGRQGKIYVDPKATDVESAQMREEALRARAAAVVGPGRLKDGSHITLLANVSDVNGAIEAAAAGADGIGLLRTELLFIDSTSEPTVEDQVATYKKIFDLMQGRRVIVRTLDAGSDKQIPYLNSSREQNPALGIRGWRLTRTHDAVLERQLEAISKAAEGISLDLWVMAPMVSTPAEANDFATRARALGIKKVGVMIETPAAAIHAEKVLLEVDFGSIGTNDLAQYVMASDRMDSRLSDLATTWNPAVLRTIQIACESANKLNKTNGVCGEAASDPYLAAVLLGLGVTSLSMVPSAIAEVREFLSTLDLATCVEVAALALNADSAQEAESLVKENLQR